MHNVEDLMRIFDDCFFESHQTRLLRGSDEPLYLPADKNAAYHRIFFAHGYFSSALHECAHWLIAGEARRLLEDYGYWYAQDGRTAEQQALFYTVEVKPQAIECLLSEAARFPFRVSSDNLDGDRSGEKSFETAVARQAQRYRETGLPWRAQKLQRALQKYYHLADREPQ